MKRSYDAERYEPPAPVLDVLLSSPESGANARIAEVALVDTGADFSVIRCGIVRQLALPLRGQTPFSGVDGRLEKAFTWAVRIETAVGAWNIDMLEIGWVTILGRDILNQLELRLDGPNNVLEVRSPRTRDRKAPRTT
ncbi:MAG: hypothetical protein JO060_10330 [Candidatus Eremiobacteraeota bacterium]|nr:hypothetical protein [Candidatus Eremiobacteraeota bacterium]MBV9648402.1 hypothetical protein [Candidatus Eremiobacteraeota bacterium]